MNIEVPGYLAPFVVSESLAIIAAVLAGLYRSLTLSGWPDRERGKVFWGSAGLLFAWFFAGVLLSRFGFYRSALSRIPTIQYGILIPILAGVALFWLWPGLRRVIADVPQQWIAGIQVYRAVGFIFLVLYAVGRLPGGFAWPAGIGDVTIGLLAPLVGIAYARNWRHADGLLRAWNLFGIGDLVVAVTTGFLSSPTRLQMFAFGSPNELISTYPLAMIPVFAVPLSILLHLASLHKLRHAEAGEQATHSVFSDAGHTLA